jgi:oligoribonuclease NrnB/cAMP/cGMP phosphodiesterase (DHH superfamily)
LVKEKDNTTRRYCMHRVIYHMDSDGKASAAVVGFFLRKSGESNIYYHPINYGMELDTSKWDRRNDHIYLVDFGFQPAQKMVDFAKKFTHFVWIDHHASSIEMEKEFPELQGTPGVREVGKAACELCWEYFSPEKVPLVLNLIGDWDVWRRNAIWESTVLPFQSFLWISDDRPQNAILWDQLLVAKDVEKWLGIGRITRFVQDRADASLMGAASFVGRFAGYKAIMCNGAGSSLMFERNFDIDRFELMVLFQLKQGKYVTVSLYGTGDAPDCGQLAKRLGEAGPIPSGGGHPKAAGFQCNWEYLQTLITQVEESKPWRKTTSGAKSISEVVKI